MVLHELRRWMARGLKGAPGVQTLAALVSVVPPLVDGGAPRRGRHPPSPDGVVLRG